MRRHVNGCISTPLDSDTAKLSIQSPIAKIMRERSDMMCYMIDCDIFIEKRNGRCKPFALLSPVITHT